MVALLKKLGASVKTLYLDPIIFALVQRIRGIIGLVREVFFVHAGA